MDWNIDSDECLLFTLDICRFCFLLIWVTIIGVDTFDTIYSKCLPVDVWELLSSLGSPFWCLVLLVFGTFLMGSPIFINIGSFSDWWYNNDLSLNT